MEDPRLDDALRVIVAEIEPNAKYIGDATLSGGISYRLKALDVEIHGRRARMVLREAANMRAGRWGLLLKDEFSLVTQLQHLGIQTPVPRHFDDSGNVLRHPFAVYDFVDGAPEMGPDNPELVGRSFAEQMAAVHQLDISQLDLRALPQWTEFVSDLLREPTEIFDSELREELIRTKLEQHWPPAAPERLCLIHGDMWPGNVVWRDGTIAALLDWENASVGDPLADVAITRLDLLWSFGSRATAAFTKRYVELTGTDLATLPLWDLFSAMRPAGDLHRWAQEYPKLGRPDVTFQTMQAHHRWFVTQALAGL